MITYRQLHKDDIQAVKEIVQLFRDQKIDDTKAQNFLNDKSILLYVAFDGNHVCGYVLCYRLPRMDLGNDMLMIYHVFVLEEYKRRHIASDLLRIVLEDAKRDDLHYVFLITQHDNDAANALYSKLGGYHHPKNKELYYWYINSNS